MIEQIEQVEVAIEATSAIAGSVNEIHAKRIQETKVEFERASTRADRPTSFLERNDKEMQYRRAMREAEKLSNSYQKQLSCYNSKKEDIVLFFAKKIWS